MKKVQNIFMLALLTWVAVGCGTENSGNEPKGENGTDSTGVEDADTIVYNDNSECDGLAARRFCRMGLDFLQLQDSLMWKQFEVDGATQKDTVFEDENVKDENGDNVAWGVRIVQFETGRIYLESDFDSGHLLNRIRIETPEYIHNSNGLHVGSELAEVAAAYKNLYVRPFPEFGVMEVFPDNKTIYHFPLDGYDIPEKGEDEALTTEDLPQDLKVTRIVLM